MGWCGGSGWGGDGEKCNYFVLRNQASSSRFTGKYYLALIADFDSANQMAFSKGELNILQFRTINFLTHQALVRRSVLPFNFHFEGI
jgi:hypothetical protein